MDTIDQDAQNMPTMDADAGSKANKIVRILREEIEQLTTATIHKLLTCPPADLCRRTPAHTNSSPGRFSDWTRHGDLGHTEY